jgi:hypothetical protein
MKSENAIFANMEAEAAELPAEIKLVSVYNLNRDRLATYGALQDR